MRRSRAVSSKPDVLDDLVRSELRRALHPGASKVAVGLLLALLGVSMGIVRGSDGPRAYLEGVVARGVSLTTLLVALPLALGLARRGAPLTLDPGLAALAALRGFSPSQAGPLLRQKLARLLLAPPAAALLLTALAAILSLPDGARAGRRLALGLLLALFAALVAALLAGLGALSARLAARRGRALLLAALLVPWIAAATLPGVPRRASLPGAYRAGVDAILSLAAR